MGRNVLRATLSLAAVTATLASAASVRAEEAAPVAATGDTAEAIIVTA